MTPVGWRLAEPEAAYVIDDCQARVLFLGDGFEAGAETLGKRPAIEHCLTAEQARKLMHGTPHVDFAPSDLDDAVLQLLAAEGCSPLCLGRTGSGHPRHPLYLPRGGMLEPYAPSCGRPSGCPSPLPPWPAFPVATPFT